MPDTYTSVRSILTSAFRVPEDEIRPEVTLGQLDLDSLALTELVLIVHERLGVRIGNEHVSRDAALAQVVDHIETLRAENAQSTERAARS